MRWLVLGLQSVRALRASRDRGATAAEYALLIAFIAAAIIGAVGFFADDLIDVFTDVGNQINTGGDPE